MKSKPNTYFLTVALYIDEQTGIALCMNGRTWLHIVLSPMPDWGPIIGNGNILMETLLTLGALLVTLTVESISQGE